MQGGLPLVDDHDEAVADPETVMNPARRLGHPGDLRELVGPVGESLAELGGVTLKLPDDQNAHNYPPRLSCLSEAGCLRKGYVATRGSGSPGPGSVSRGPAPKPRPAPARSGPLAR